MTDALKIPPDINNHRTVISAPEKIRTLSIGIYKGNGAGDAGIDDIKKNIRNILEADFAELGAEQIKNDDLGRFDLIIFSGGGASKQGESIGEIGRENIRSYIKGGGSYLGVCAGAYLATANFDWSLRILNAETLSKTEWQRGKAFLDLEITSDGENILGKVEGKFKCRYNNGPLFRPMGLSELPAYKVAAYFRSEVADNGATPGVMVNTPAAIFSEYGEGKVFVVSPHPENTPGLENFLPRVVAWLVDTHN